MELVVLNLTIGLVHARQVHLRVEVDLRGLGGVVGAALDGQEEDAVVELGVSRAHNSTIPVGEGGVITYTYQLVYVQESILFILTIGETIRHALVAKLSLLSLFKLLVEAEGSGHYIN